MYLNRKEVGVMAILLLAMIATIGVMATKYYDSRDENAVLKQSLAQLARENAELKITQVPQRHDGGKGEISGVIFEGKYILDVPDATILSVMKLPSTENNLGLGDGPRKAELFKIVKNGNKLVGYVQRLQRVPLQ